MPVNSLQDLYLNKLQMLYDAEQQLLQVMPQLTQMVTNTDLRMGLEAHRRQSEEQVRRLEQLFQRHGQSPRGVPCVSMQALVQEAQQMIQQVQDPDTLDAFVIAAEQAVEHHEIAGYGTARTWARQLGHTGDADLLQRTLQEEEGTDQLLTDIAERMVNQAAASTEGARTDRDVTPRAQFGDVPTGADAAGAPARRTTDADAADLSA